MSEERISGIYCIRHLESGRKYIGRAVDIKRRDRRHWAELRGQYHSNMVLQRAFNKYGREAFVFEVIESCQAHELVTREQYWIDLYGVTNLFNMLPLAASTGGKPLPLDTRNKISRALKGRKRILSPETLEKMRIGAIKGRMNRGPLSVEQKAAMLRGKLNAKKRVCTEEERKRYSEFFKKIPRTEAWRKNISIALTGKKRK